MKRFCAASLATLAFAVLAGVTFFSQEGRAMNLQISSPAFTEGGDIPRRYTCDGEDLAPPLHWAGIPAGTRSLVLIVDDPDAPDPASPKMTWVHWVLYNIPPTSSGLPGGPGGGALPAGSRVGVNDWKRADWGGPCPPVGRHRYFFKLYALDIELPDLGAATKTKVLQAMQGHVLAETALVGGYRR